MVGAATSGYNYKTPCYKVVVSTDSSSTYSSATDYKTTNNTVSNANRVTGDGWVTITTSSEDSQFDYYKEFLKLLKLREILLINKTLSKYYPKQHIFDNFKRNSNAYVANCLYVLKQPPQYMHIIDKIKKQKRKQKRKNKIWG